MSEVESPVTIGRLFFLGLASFCPFPVITALDCVGFCAALPAAGCDFEAVEEAGSQQAVGIVLIRILTARSASCMSFSAMALKQSLFDVPVARAIRPRQRSEIQGDWRGRLHDVSTGRWHPAQPTCSVDAVVRAWWVRAPKLLHVRYSSRGPNGEGADGYDAGPLKEWEGAVPIEGFVAWPRPQTDSASNRSAFSSATAGNSMEISNCPSSRSRTWGCAFIALA